MNRNTSAFLLTLILLFSLSACNNNDGPAWGSYRNDGTNSGSVLVRTGIPDRPDWRIEVGPGIFSGPVVGEGGVIYLGQRNGGLLAIGPTGNMLWTAALTGLEGGNSILSTPAIAEDGSIYINVTNYVDEISTLHKISPSGDELWVLTLPKPTLGSPTLWENIVFVASYDELDGGIYVVESNGNLRLDLSEETSDPCLVQGQSIFPVIFGLLGDFFSNFPFGIEFDGSTPATKPPVSAQPTISMVDPEIIGGLDNPIVVLPQYCSVLFYEWTGAGFSRLEHDIFESGEPHRFTTAAVSSSGQVVIGSENGRLRSYRIDATFSPPGTGKEWTADLGEAISLDPAVTPLPAVKDIYVVTTNRVWAISADGDDIDSVILSESVTTPPVISADHVFVGIDSGLVTLTWDLSIVGMVDGVAPWVYRSPAIGEEGEIILAESDGLMKFSEE